MTDLRTQFSERALQAIKILIFSDTIQKTPEDGIPLFVTILTTHSLEEN
jgi:hypothetical protein